MRSKATKDPRLADLDSLTSNPAPDMPTPGGAEKTKTKVIRRRRKLSIPQSPIWGKYVLPLATICLLCYGAYLGVKSVNRTLTRNQEQKTIADVWRQLLLSRVTVEGTPLHLDENGVSRFPSVTFENINSKIDMHRNIRLATALPGVKEIGIMPFSTRKIGVGVADDETLQLVADKFKDLQSLDLSATRVTMLEPIIDMPIERLNLVNTLVKREKLGTLQLLRSVQTLSIGWEPNSRNPEHELYYSKTFRKRLLEFIAKMPNLQTLNLYEITLTGEELKQFSGIKVTTIRNSGS